MKTLYIAEDGTQFLDESECEEYEKQLMCDKYSNVIFGLNEDGDEIDFDEDFFANAATIFLGTQDAVDFCYEHCDEIGISCYGIDGPGYWIYDYDLRKYKSAKTVIEDLTAQIEDIQETMKFFQSRI